VEPAAEPATEPRPAPTRINKAPTPATDAAYRVHLVHLALRVNQESLVNQARQACPEHLVSHRSSLAKWSLHLRASRALLDHLVHPVHPAHLETLVIKEPLAVQALMLLQDHPDPLDHLDHQARPEPTDRPATLVPLLKANHSSPANPETPEIKDRPDRPVRPATPARTESPVSPDRKDPRDRPDRPATTDNPARPVRPDHRVRPERRVSAPSTARSTAACSSRTERGDKRRIWPFIISGTFLEMDIFSMVSKRKKSQESQHDRLLRQNSSYSHVSFSTRI